MGGVVPRRVERMPIARDAHETLLQGFQGLMFRLEAVRALLPARPAEAVAVLDAALLVGEASIDAARAATRVAVRRPRSSEHAGADLATGVAALVAAAAAAARSAPEKAPSWRLVARGAARQIPAPVRGELYAVTRQALGDAFGRGRAGQVAVEVRYRADSLLVSVAIERVASGSAPVSSARRVGHVGLNAMRERMEHLGGRLAVRRQPRGGTRLLLSAPAAVAYVDSPPSGAAMPRGGGARPRSRPRD